MNIQIPNQVKARFAAFRQTGSLGEGATREAMDETTIGGAGFVVHTLASTYDSLDETKKDRALNQKGYVDVSPDYLKQEPVLSMSEARAEISKGETNVVTVAGKTRNGNEGYQQFLISEDAVSAVMVEVQDGQYAMEAIKVTDAGGYGEQLSGTWNIAE